MSIFNIINYRNQAKFGIVITVDVLTGKMFNSSVSYMNEYNNGYAACATTKTKPIIMYVVVMKN